MLNKMELHDPVTPTTTVTGKSSRKSLDTYQVIVGVDLAVIILSIHKLAATRLVSPENFI